MATGTFATVINCIDGRAKHPVGNWMKFNLHVNFVDQITEPGPEKVLTEGTAAQIEDLQRKVAISVNAHHSSVIAIAAHHDCAGNPVSADEHKEQVRRSIGVVRGWGLNVQRIIGLWVNDHWQIEVLSDSGAQGQVLVSYAAALTCTDGRAVSSVSDWTKQHFHVNYVDLLTMPEMDSFLLRATPEQIAEMRRRVEHVMHEHQLDLLLINAHYDCAGNTMSAGDRKAQLSRCVQMIDAWELPLRIVGVWTNESWQNEIVADSSVVGTMPMRAVRT